MMFCSLCDEPSYDQPWCVECRPIALASLHRKWATPAGGLPSPRKPGGTYLRHYITDMGLGRGRKSHMDDIDPEHEEGYWDNAIRHLEDHPHAEI